MRKTKVTIDFVSEKMAEAIEMLMNNNDEGASENEKIDVEQAKAIAKLGGVIIDGFKVKAQVLNMMRRTDNPGAMKELSDGSGIISIES